MSAYRELSKILQDALRCSLPVNLVRKAGASSNKLHALQTLRVGGLPQGFREAFGVRLGLPAL
ncbi:MAG: hypothetical protein DME26_16370 [Verrucomicrobia bacterium]|nr:MAG: hypothetical protein DME26_16370 [Verrucomicrobiota bacterium]